MSLPQRHPDRGLLLAGIAASLAWGALAFVHLCYLTIPTMDNWCYFAPSAVAPHPGGIITPYLGSFGGADHLWCLHWPAVPFLNSLVFSALPASAELYVLWHLVLWLGAAASIAWLVHRVTGSRFATLTALGLVLGDRAMFAIAGWQRMELMSLIAVCPLVWTTTRRAHGDEPSAHEITLEIIGAFLAPLMHPVAGALALGAIGAGFILHRRPSGGTLRFPHGAAIALVWGGIALATCLLGRREGLAQFLDHARVASKPIVPGQIFWRAFQEMYAPSFVGPLLYGGGLLLAAAVLAWPRAGLLRPEDIRPGRALASLAVVVFAALHVFSNTYYLVFLLPVLLPLWALAWRRAAERWSLMASPWPAVAAVSLLCIHGVFWATRSFKWWQTGFADLRGELKAFWTELPPARRIYIPDALWEMPRLRPNGAEILMTTIPNNSSTERRLAYEQGAYSTAQPGDLLVLDAFQTNRPLRAFPPEEWEDLGRRTRLLPSRSPWGWDFRTYRRR